MLDRIDAAGPSEISDDFLRRIGEDAMSPDQVLRLMRLDAGGYGRRRVAEQLLERGDAARALSVLRPSRIASTVNASLPLAESAPWVKETRTPSATVSSEPS